MAITATVIPRDARVTAKGRTVSFAVSEELDLNAYSILVDVPCTLSLEPLPTPADDVEVDMIEDDVFEIS